MGKRPVRRAQLIAPFGPGAMMVSTDGSVLIAAGLDHWYDRPSPSLPFDPTEFYIPEWRLEHELEVDHFRLPPDFRVPPPDAWGREIPNTFIRIPFLRFPRWHVCPICSRLEEFPLEQKSRPRCPACESTSQARRYRRAPFMVQVRFVAMCDQGHIQDFPWREWVHYDHNPRCEKPMKLIATPGASLAATLIRCECEAQRSLFGITQADPPAQPDSNNEETQEAEPSTFLSRELAPGRNFLCQGHHPWLAEEDGRGCGRPLRGSLRGATNVYFAITRSAIYLPRGNEAVSSELVTLLEEYPLSGALSLLASLHQEPTPAILRHEYSDLLKSYSDAEISAAISALEGKGDTDTVAEVEDDDSETAFRRAEHAALRATSTKDQLRVRPASLTDCSSDVRNLISSITLVEQLRETRAFTGFSRTLPDNGMTLEDRKSMLWRTPPNVPNRWLPAYQVFGEGIYIELDETALNRWEQRHDVVARAERLYNRYREVQARRDQPLQQAISPRFVMIHTFAHLLMNQLIFECGYSSASLRERLYVSDHSESPMAGLLIYTAAGDAEGTMGGLVRMGKPHLFEPILRSSIQNASWCSSDPVCMELGDSGGQGPDSCNLAACHNCSLVPETSCEQFNRFLDRWLVVGSEDDPTAGFFSSLR